MISKNSKYTLSIVIITALALCISLFATHFSFAFDDIKVDQTFIYIAKVDENGELIDGVKYEYSTSDGKPLNEVSMEQTQRVRLAPANLYYYVNFQFFDFVEAPGGGYELAPSRDFNTEITLTETEAPPEYELAKPITIKLGSERDPESYSMVFSQDNSIEISSLYSLLNRPISLSSDPNGVVRQAYINRYGLQSTSAKWPVFLVINHLKKHEIKIAKKEEGGSYLAGAVFEITGTTIKGKEIDKITVTSKDEAVAAGIPAGTYTLHEVTPPPGYELAADIVFTVEKDGSVTIDGKTVSEVSMTDPKKYEPKPLLSVKKTSNVKSAKPGDVIPFTVTVSNKGDADADEVVVLDTMGAGLSYVSDDSNGESDGQKVSWKVKVAAGATKTISINCRINKSASGKVINNVEIVNIEKEYIESSEGEDEYSIVLSEYEETKEVDEDENKKDEKDEEEKDSSGADTGDTTSMISLIILAISSLVLAALIKARRIS